MGLFAIHFEAFAVLWSIVWRELHTGLATWTKESRGGTQRWDSFCTVSWKGTFPIAFGLPTWNASPMVPSTVAILYRASSRRIFFVQTP